MNMTLDLTLEHVVIVAVIAFVVLSVIMLEPLALPISEVFVSR